jgi:hypothetical protein
MNYHQIFSEATVSPFNGLTTAAMNAAAAG